MIILDNFLLVTSHRVGNIFSLIEISALVHFQILDDAKYVLSKKF